MLKLSECYPSGSESTQRNAARKERAAGLIHEYQGDLHTFEGQRVNIMKQLKGALVNGTKESIERERAKLRNVDANIDQAKEAIEMLSN